MYRKMENVITSVTNDEQIPACANYFKLVKRAALKNHDDPIMRIYIAGMLKVMCDHNPIVDNLHQKIKNHLAMEGRDYVTE
jgi:hypothetical protein